MTLLNARCNTSIAAEKQPVDPSKYKRIVEARPCRSKNSPRPVSKSVIELWRRWRSKQSLDLGTNSAVDWGPISEKTFDVHADGDATFGMLKELVRRSRDDTEYADDRLHVLCLLSHLWNKALGISELGAFARRSKHVRRLKNDLIYSLKLH